ncbi:MFS general substrate transporter [Mycena crocata]|nr:MFS general substrate transporter [Mycena crocata]
MADESQPLLQNIACPEDQTPRITPLPKAQLTALCIARLSDPISYTQIFPYINEFLTILHVTDDPSKIGFYSGLVESTSSVAQLLTMIGWTKLSDIIGRRPVILFSALGLVIVSLALGLCRTFFQILAVRAITGLLVGNVAVYQTILTELTDSTNEASAYPVYSFIYPLGSTVGPMIGGFFSNLATRYPERLGYAFLESYPYFMPGFICALLALLGFVLTYCFLEETLPSKREPPKIFSDDSASVVITPSAMGIYELLAVPRVWVLTVSSAAMEFLGTGFSVVFVLFCYTSIEAGGLGLSVSEISYTLAMSSAVLALFQLFLMPHLLRRFDAAQLYVWCMGVWPVTFAFVPLLSVIARMALHAENTGNKQKHDIYWMVLWVGIGVVHICSRVATLTLPIRMVLVRNNCPDPASLSAVTGLTQFSMALSRCVSPAFVSTVFALSIEHKLLNGNLWVVAMTLVAVFGYYNSLSVENPKRND